LAPDWHWKGGSPASALPPRSLSGLDPRPHLGVCTASSWASRSARSRREHGFDLAGKWDPRKRVVLNRTRRGHARCQGSRPCRDRRSRPASPRQHGLRGTGSSLLRAVNVPYERLPGRLKTSLRVSCCKGALWRGNATARLPASRSLSRGCALSTSMQSHPPVSPAPRFAKRNAPRCRRLRGKGRSPPRSTGAPRTVPERMARRGSRWRQERLRRLTWVQSS
jgi:hypothetical protein